MAHKSGRSSYKAKPGHPAKSLPSQASPTARARAFGQQGRAKKPGGAVWPTGASTPARRTSLLPLSGRTKGQLTSIAARKRAAIRKAQKGK